MTTQRGPALSDSIAHAEVASSARAHRPARQTSGLDVGGRLVLGAGVAFAVYLIAAPLCMLLLTAFRGPDQVLPFEAGAHWSLEHFRVVYSDPVLYTRVLPQTLVFALGSVMVTASIAFTLAWLIERTDLPGRNVWYALILFPLLVPSVMLGIAWIWLFGPNAGWVNLAIRALLGTDGAGPLQLFSMPGLIACQAMATTPFMFLMFGAVLRAMNPALEEASSVSGATPWQSFSRITLPVLMPGIAAPVILSLLIALEQFEMPLIIGLPAGINVFSTRVFYELSPASGLPNYGAAAAVSMPFLLIGFALLALYNFLIRRADRYVTVVGKAFRPARFALRHWRWPALAAVATYVSVAAVLPAFVLVWISLVGYAFPSREALRQVSLEAYITLFANERVWLAVVNTLVVAGASALIATTIGALLAWLLARRRFRGKFLVDALSFVSIGIPAVIAGLGLMVFYLSVPIGLYGTIWMLVLAYAYRITVTTRVNRSGLMQLHRELEEASAISGAVWLQTMRRIVWPLVAPSLAASFVLLFILGFREFTLPMLLGSQENVVLPVILWRLFEAGQPAPTAALGTLMIAIVIPIVFVLRRVIDPEARHR